MQNSQDGNHYGKRRIEVANCDRVINNAISHIFRILADRPPNAVSAQGAPPGRITTMQSVVVNTGLKTTRAGTAVFAFSGCIRDTSYIIIYANKHSLNTNSAFWKMFRHIFCRHVIIFCGSPSAREVRRLIIMTSFGWCQSWPAHMSRK